MELSIERRMSFMHDDFLLSLFHVLERGLCGIPLDGMQNAGKWKKGSPWRTLHRNYRSDDGLVVVTPRKS